MNNTEILLSICIPTYNRANYLYSNLLSIFKQIGEDSSVEVIVSDNNSTDSTSNIVKEFFEFNNFHYYRNPENIGMPKNIMRAVSYARGRFCWIIGDDDFIKYGAINSVVNLIEKYLEVDFIYVNVETLQLERFNDYGHPFDTTKYIDKVSESEISIEIVEKWEELISPRYSIVFLGEIMASIFKRDIWCSYELKIEGNFLDNIETTYPFCVVYANKYFGRKALYVHTPMVLALEGIRDWWDKIGYIQIVIIKDLLDLYKEKGLSGKILKECYSEYIKGTLWYAYKYLTDTKVKYRSKVSLKKYTLFLLSHPILVFIAVIQKWQNVRRRMIRVKQTES